MGGLKILAAAVLNEDNPEFFDKLMKNGVDAVEPEMRRQQEKRKSMIKINCPYCNKELHMNLLKVERESGFPVKYCPDCKNWIVYGWDKKSCLKCKIETKLKDDGKSNYWYCEKCSKDTLIDAICEISVNTREEVTKFVLLGDKE